MYKGLAVFILVLCFAAVSPAQKVGAYKEIAKTDASAQAAAEFAVSAQASKTKKEIQLVSVFKAERQVVAGTNFRLCLKVNTQGANGEADAITYVRAVVYTDLKGVKKLTSWVDSDCGSDDEDTD